MMVNFMVMLAPTSMGLPLRRYGCSSTLNGVESVYTENPWSADYGEILDGSVFEMTGLRTISPEMWRCSGPDGIVRVAA